MGAAEVGRGMEPKPCISAWLKLRYCTRKELQPELLIS